jgi:transmembrane sensor
MTGPEAKQLLEKYNQGNCTAEEKALVERWYLSESSKQALPEDQDQDDFTAEKIQMWYEISEMSGIENKSKISRIILWGTSIAAAVLITISVGSNFFKYKRNKIGSERNKTKGLR